MKKQVIFLYGASGSGTTTLGRYVSEQLCYRFMDTDDYFWLPSDPPYSQQREKGERVRLIREDLSKLNNVVLSGSLDGWGDALIPGFTLAVRVVIDPKIRLERLRKREADRFGTRIALGGDMYEHHQKFMAWAAEYDTAGLTMRSKARHDQWQKQLPCKSLTVCGSDALQHNFELIQAALAE